MKTIFWRRIPCECEGKSVECWEKRSRGESLRLLLLIPVGWAVLLRDWIYAE